MHPTDALAMLESMGLEISTVHDKLAVQPRARITAEARDIIRLHRDGLVAVIQAPRPSASEPVGPSPARRLPEPSEIAERSAILSEGAGLDAGTADALALQAEGFDSFEALADEHRRMILRELEGLPASAWPAAMTKLAAATRAFLASSDFICAVSEGWDMLELFGVNPTGPLGRLDGQGLAVAVALSRHALRIDAVDCHRAVLVTGSGSRLTYGRFRYDLADVMHWWKCPALTGITSPSHRSVNA